MDCKKIEDLISMYVENELSKEVHKEISLHLRQCEKCRELKEKVEELIYVFPELEEEVPFFLKNRLLYIPESQTMQERRESRFYFLKWMAAVIGTFVMLLNLFYFTNILPPAHRALHQVMAEIKTLTVETGAFLEKITASEDLFFFSFLKSDSDDDPDKDTEENIENNLDINGGKNG